MEELERYKRTNRTMFLVGEQNISSFGDEFGELISAWGAESGQAFSLAADAYLLGVMMGKRIERERRKTVREGGGAER